MYGRTESPGDNVISGTIILRTLPRHKMRWLPKRQPGMAGGVCGGTSGTTLSVSSDHLWLFSAMPAHDLSCLVSPNLPDPLTLPFLYLRSLCALFFLVSCLYGLVKWPGEGRATWVMSLGSPPFPISFFPCPVFVCNLHQTWSIE